MNPKYILLSICMLVPLVSRSQQGKKVVQINIEKLLNARPVTTIVNGKLKSWTIGIDGGGKGDGYLTMTASVLNGDKNAGALPDNALITANMHHPEILLHYKNGDAGNQTCNIAGGDSCIFDVPHYKYNDLYLSLTSSEGPSRLHIKLTYADGIDEKDFILPDYYDDIPENHPDLSYVVHNLAKWGPENNMTEADHHNIDALNIHPDKNRVLKSVTVVKGTAGYLVFWAATGVVNQ